MNCELLIMNFFVPLNHFCAYARGVRIVKIKEYTT